MRKEIFDEKLCNFLLRRWKENFRADMPVFREKNLLLYAFTHKHMSANDSTPPPETFIVKEWDRYLSSTKVFPRQIKWKVFTISMNISLNRPLTFPRVDIEIFSCEIFWKIFFGRVFSSCVSCDCAGDENSRTNGKLFSSLSKVFIHKFCAFRQH